MAKKEKTRARKCGGISDTPSAKPVWHASYVSRLCTSLDMHRLGGLSLSGQAPRHRFEREEKKLSIRGVEDWRASGMGLAGTARGKGDRGWRTEVETGSLPGKRTGVEEESKGRMRPARGRGRGIDNGFCVEGRRDAGRERHDRE